MEYRSFPAQCTDDGPDPQTRSWMTARFHGFLEPLPAPGELAAIAAAWQDEGRILHAAYDDRERPAPALSSDVPVATVATLEGTLEAGGPVGIPCLLVADVTVNATHRARGIMRRLMQLLTSEAASAGVPMMALHAAHPALYARFGFAPAVRAASVEVACARFTLRNDPHGTVHEADPQQADELGRTVAAAAGAGQFGALAIKSPSAGEPTGEHAARRCLVHVDGDGAIDGVITYVFHGWTPQAQVLEVLSETYATMTAHAALWATLCSTGIATTVRAKDARTDDPLPWMITDRSAWQVLGLNDGFSLRVVDPGRALQMRGYSGPDAQLTIRVTDESGVAAGTWLVRISGGRASVERSSQVPDITLGARELAAAFLGTTRTITLRNAGLDISSPEAANALDALLSWPREACSSLHF